MSHGIFAALCAVSAVLSAASHPSDIQQVVSDGNGRRLKELEPIKWEFSVNSHENTIEINPENKFQRFDGFGGSFMRAGAKLFYSMPEKVQDEILTDLFDPHHGAGFVLGKIPIGATDFGVPEWYTYADEPQAQSLPEFSMAHDLEQDQDGFGPYLKRAQAAAGRPMRLQATMDYPPGWMLNTSTPLPFPDLNSTFFFSM